jgi:hypothetical protein
MSAGASQQLCFALANGVAFLLHEWRLVRPELVALTPRERANGVGNLTGNLKSRLDTGDSGFDSEWRSYLNILSGRTWSLPSTVKRLLDSAAKHKSASTLNPAWSVLDDPKIAVELILAYQIDLSLGDCLRPDTFEAWLMRRRKPEELRAMEGQIDALFNVPDEYARRYNSKDTSIYRDIIEDHLDDLKSHRIRAIQEIRDRTFNWERFKKQINKASFTMELLLIEAGVSAVGCKTFQFSDAGFSEKRIAVWAKDQSRQRILRVLRQAAKNRIEIKRLIYLDSLNPESYSPEEFTELALDLAHQLNAGVYVRLAEKAAAMECASDDGHGHKLGNFALDNNGTVMKADNSHCSWQVAKLSPQDTEYVRTLNRYREFEHTAGSRAAKFSPEEFHPGVLLDRRRFESFRRQVWNRMSDAAGY